MSYTSTQSVSFEELCELFPKGIPIEMINLCFSCPDDWTPCRLREEITNIAVRLSVPATCKAEPAQVTVEDMMEADRIINTHCLGYQSAADHINAKLGGGS